MIKFFNRYWSKPAVISFVVEALLLFSSVWVAYHLRFPGKFGVLTDDWPILIRAATFVMAFVTAAYLNGLYDLQTVRSNRQLAIRFLRSFSFATLALGTIYYFVPFLFLGRGLLVISLVSAVVSISVWRLLLFWVLRKKLFGERLLIVGSDESAQELAAEILARQHLGYRIVGFLADDASLQGKSLVNPRVLGTTSEACEIALDNSVTRVVVAQRERRGQLDLEALLRCKTKGIPVEAGKDYYERLTGKIALDSFRLRSWLLFSRGFVVSPAEQLFKRVVDLAFSTVALLLVAPIVALTAMAIWFESGLPVLYRQERVGRDGQLFTLLKFRSMKVDAEAEGRPQWADRQDPRVTRVGKVLRNYRLDELPQLLNILAGDMSLVGPRPERKEFADQLTEMESIYEQRLVVRPGLTGWAQINASYASSYEQSMDKLQYDLYYIKNISIFLDLSILASTLRAVLLGRGAQ